MPLGQSCQKGLRLAFVSSQVKDTQIQRQNLNMIIIFLIGTLMGRAGQAGQGRAGQGRAGQGKIRYLLLPETISTGKKKAISCFQKPYQPLILERSLNLFFSISDFD